MRIFKYKTFEKWAKKQGMSNEGLSLNDEQINILIDKQNLIEVL